MVDDCEGVSEAAVPGAFGCTGPTGPHTDGESAGSGDDLLPGGEAQADDFGDGSAPAGPGCAGHTVLLVVAARVGNGVDSER